MKVLLNGSVSRRGETILAERFSDRLSIALTDEDDAPDDRAAKFAEAEIIVSIEYTQDMPSAPAARLLHLPNSGLDAVDMAAVPDGCAVCNCYEHEVGISEYVMAGILDWTVGLAEFDGRFRGGAWDDSPRFSAPTRGELPGKVLATIGYGNIGRAVAVRARAFGMVVHALTRSPRDFNPPPDWQGGIAKLDEILPADRRNPRHVRFPSAFADEEDSGIDQCLPRAGGRRGRSLRRLPRRHDRRRRDRCLVPIRRSRWRSLAPDALSITRPEKCRYDAAPERLDRRSDAEAFRRHWR
jgi:hypothetical protein